MSPRRLDYVHGSHLKVCHLRKQKLRNEGLKIKLKNKIEKSGGAMCTSLHLKISTDSAETTWSTSMFCTPWWIANGDVVRTNCFLNVYTLTIFPR